MVCTVCFSQCFDGGNADGNVNHSLVRRKTLSLFSQEISRLFGDEFCESLPEDEAKHRMRRW